MSLFQCSSRKLKANQSVWVHPLPSCDSIASRFVYPAPHMSYLFIFWTFSFPSLTCYPLRPIRYAFRSTSLNSMSLHFAVIVHTDHIALSCLCNVISLACKSMQWIYVWTNHEQCCSNVSYLLFESWATCVVQRMSSVVTWFCSYFYTSPMCHLFLYVSENLWNEQFLFFCNFT